MKLRQEDMDNDVYPTVIEKFTSYRYRLCYVLILGMALMQCHLNSMAFALVCMTGGLSGTNISEELLFENGSSSYDTPDNISTSVYLLQDHVEKDQTTKPEFSWDSATQGLLLSSPFYAALISPFVSTSLSRKHGAKIVIGSAMCIDGIVSVLTPVAARTHLYLAVACRIVVGFVSNMIFPTSQAIWAQWAPVQDKAQLLSFTFSGMSIASVVTFSVSGFLCTVPFDNGWPLIFYIFGGLAICWSLLWATVAHNTPESHPAISEKEKVYIASNRKGVVASEKKPKVPWKSLLSSPPFWAYVFSFFNFLWNASFMFQFLPLYMSTVMDFKPSENGLLSSVPYITRLAGQVVWTVLSGAFLRHLSVTATRKCVEAIGTIGFAVLTLGIIYTPTDHKAIVLVLLALLSPFQCAFYTGALVTPLDFAPQFAPVIAAFGNCAVVLSQLLSPQIISLIIVDRTKEQWDIAFYLNAGIQCLALLVFLLFGSGELQPWAHNSQPPTDQISEACSAPLKKKRLESDVKAVNTSVSALLKRVAQLESSAIRQETIQAQAKTVETLSSDVKSLKSMLKRRLGPEVEPNNLALHKPATASTVQRTARIAGPVDGSPATNWRTGSCFEALLTDKVPWWQVDLESPYVITEVRVTARGDCFSEELHDFAVEVFKDNPEAFQDPEPQLCYMYADEKTHLGGTISRNCTQPVTGQYVRITGRKKRKSSDNLQFCEMQVFGSTAEKRLR